MVITADGFGGPDPGDHWCQLTRLERQIPSRRLNEYRATFWCVVPADKTVHVARYWIGFYVSTDADMFMFEANANFTRPLSRR